MIYNRSPRSASAGEPGRPTAGISGPVRDQSVWRLHGLAAPLSARPASRPGCGGPLAGHIRRRLASGGIPPGELFPRRRGHPGLLPRGRAAARFAKVYLPSDPDEAERWPPTGASGSRARRTGGTPAAGGAGLERAASNRASGPSGVGRLFSEPGAPDGLPAIPGPGMADRIGAGGKHCKLVINQRLKGSGMRWGEGGSAGMAHLPPPVPERTQSVAGLLEPGVRVDRRAEPPTKVTPSHCLRNETQSARPLIPTGNGLPDGVARPVGASG